MRILVIGSGGREHALLKGLHADSLTTELHAAPGAPAFAELATNHSEYSQVDDPARMLELAQKIEAELVVVGPEVPLVAGVADVLREQGIAVFGPSKEAAQIEAPRPFAKDVMAAADVATARAEQVSPDASDDEIAAALDRFGPHYVVKDDGLAGGKGVVVTEDRSVALDHIHAVHSAGNPVLLESFLEGPEVSLFCLVDGETVVPLLPAQDHKRAYDNDEGPNTGGMGAYTPLPWLPEDGVERIVKEVCEPVAKEMVKRGTPYNGLLYAGLAWGPEGPAVVEFNCRFGDPETQAVLSLLESPLAEALNATATGKLAELEPLKWKDATPSPSSWPPKATRLPRARVESSKAKASTTPQRVLHAGTKLDEDNNVVANGGRVLNVLGAGSTLAEAREKAYDVLEGLKLEGGFYRRDIGKRAQDGEISI
ncbi:phosphoribosylamine--glycine ligase [Corynebacterium camporealensis]|uniref:phosphoribosylamine--glycine ligase n=1 Tax=Corynebacterium camporealensis TaxID=161896 RepID=UPI00201193A0|nr:phosphoribosylamine--glycine ligase [Corynebacterium camporealensis]